MDLDNDEQFDEYPNPPDVFNKDFDTNLLTKISTAETTPYIENEHSSYGNSKYDPESRFDSRTFARPKRNSQSTADVKSVEPADEFHDASEREVVAVTSDGPVENLSKAAGSRIPGPRSPTKLASPKKVAERINSNGISNENKTVERTDPVEGIDKNTAQWEGERRELELLAEEKSNAAMNSSNMIQPSDNNLELKIMAELNNEYAACMMAQSKRTEEILSKQIKKLSTDNSVLLKELDVMHSAMSDLHKRYDRARGIINQMKKREDGLEEEIRQCQEELRNSEENCRYISKTCDDKLEEANSRIEMIKQETEKDRVMMEASIKRLELECKSWHSKFLDKESSEKELIAICDSLMGVKEQEMAEQ